jgi:hypothetical protein
MKQDAYNLQARFAKEFNVTNACKTLYHQDQMCMFSTDFSPSGPFPTAQWAVFFRPDQVIQYTISPTLFIPIYLFLLICCLVY